jgi:hypothetical protein
MYVGIIFLFVPSDIIPYRAQGKVEFSSRGYDAEQSTVQMLTLFILRRTYLGMYSTRNFIAFPNTTNIA